MGGAFPPNLTASLGRLRVVYWRLDQPLLRSIARLFNQLYEAVLSVPVRIKIGGIVLLPVLILGFTLNYWITTGFQDWLSYLLSDQRVQAAMQAGSRSVTLVTVLAAAASVLLALLLTYLLTQPLLQLRTVAQDVSAGRLQSRAKVYTNDEIGEVAKAVNAMLDQLVTSQDRLAQTNVRLEALNRVAMAAGREPALDRVLAAIMGGLLDVTGLESGWVYLTEEDTARYYVAHAQRAPEAILVGDEAQPCLCLDDLCARRLGRAATVRRCTRTELTNGDPVIAHITVPLQARGHALGLINLLCRPDFAPSASDMELIAAIGAQASEIVANAWLHARLVEKEAARRALLESLVRTQEDERSRLARELHDGAGQTLTTLLVRLKALEKQAPPGALHEGLVRLQALAAGSIEQVRDLSYELRPATLEEFGLARALETLLSETARAAGLTVHTHLVLNCSLPKAVETALYRIAQESLSNLLRHAGAQRCEVELMETPLGVALRVEDDGCGFDSNHLPAQADRRHLGLISMQERAEMLGGSLVVASAPGAGTSVQVRIPLPRAEVSP